MLGKTPKTVLLFVFALMFCSATSFASCFFPFWSKNGEAPSGTEIFEVLIVELNTSDLNKMIPKDLSGQHLEEKVFFDQLVKQRIDEFENSFLNSLPKDLQITIKGVSKCYSVGTIAFSTTSEKDVSNLREQLRAFIRKKSVFVDRISVDRLSE